MPNPFALPFRLIKTAIRHIAPHIPLPLYRRWLPRNPIGFFYHAVSDGDLPHVRHLYPYKSTAEFEEDLRYLKRHFTLVGYADLLAHFTGEKPLPPRAAHISFDDGFSECYHVVRPILRRHNAPCTFFLTTDWVDNAAMFYRAQASLCIERFAQASPEQQQALLSALRHAPGNPNAAPGHSPSVLDLLALPHASRAWLDRACEILEVDIPGFLHARQPFLTRAQIREMQAEGFVFGAHTRSHPKLNTLPPPEQAAEIVASCRIVGEITGQDQVPFAFPFSGNGVERDFLARLRAEHPHVGLLFDTGRLRRDRPFIFHRIWVDRPAPGIAPARNLAHWLHDAYVRELQ